MIKRQLKNEKQWFAFASNFYRKLKLNCKIAKIFKINEIQVFKIKLLISLFIFIHCITTD